jgi:NADPH2:quinone reductase
MRAIAVESLTGPGAMRVVDAPEPVGSHPQSGGARVLVAVQVAGLSVVDALQARGRYQDRLDPPYIAGTEMAGVVLEASEGSGFAVGDRVCGNVFHGGLAERALAVPDYTIRMPNSMSFGEGAALYVNYSTAWFTCYRAGLVPGETVLVQGAAGGVGSAAVEIVRSFGATPIAVVSSPEKAVAARRCGARDVVLTSEPWRERVLELTGGRGVDVVIDPVGGDRFLDSLRCLAIGGRLMVVGFTGGSIPTVRVNRLLLRNLSVIGVAMHVMDRAHPGTLRTVRTAIQTLVDAGELHPQLDSRYPLEEAGSALERLESGAAIGKVLVDVGPPS